MSFAPCSIWTVEGDSALEDKAAAGQEDEEGDIKSLSPSTNPELSEEDTKILLEKEFDDYYEVEIKQFNLSSKSF